MSDRIPRHWCLISRRGDGKSTFASKLNPEYLVADLDGRWVEQKSVSAGKSHIIAEHDPYKLAAEMEKMRIQVGPYVKTVIFDSGTAILDFFGARGRLADLDAKGSGKKHSNDDENKLKADSLRLLRLAALRWHCDVLWIFHIEDNMKAGAKGERTTISKMELERMKANLNAVLTIVKDKTGMRGIRIEWSRYNDNVAATQVIWDTDGMWNNVPERLDDFLVNYTGNEGFNGNVYSGEWLFNYLASKGIQFADVHEMYVKLDIKDEPKWYDKNGWAAIVKKALAEPVK